MNSNKLSRGIMDGLPIRSAFAVTCYISFHILLHNEKISFPRLRRRILKIIPTSYLIAIKMLFFFPKQFFPISFIPDGRDTFKKDIDLKDRFAFEWSFHRVELFLVARKKSYIRSK